MNTDNKLIAEFMGCTNPFNEIHDATLYKVEQGTFELDELQYNISWDWLMPVVEKYYNELEHIEDDDFFWRSRLHEQLLDINLAGIYQTIIDFITYHNNQKP